MCDSAVGGETDGVYAFVQVTVLVETLHDNHISN